MTTGTRTKAGFAGRLDAPHSIDGRRVLASFTREDEEGYIVIFNEEATPFNMHGEDAPDSYVVAHFIAKGDRLTVIARDLAYMTAVSRAAEAAYMNEG